MFYNLIEDYSEVISEVDVLRLAIRLMIIGLVALTSRSAALTSRMFYYYKHLPC